MQSLDCCARSLRDLIEEEIEVLESDYKGVECVWKELCLVLKLAAHCWQAEETIEASRSPEARDYWVDDDVFEVDIFRRATPAAVANKDLVAT